MVYIVEMRSRDKQNQEKVSQGCCGIGNSRNKHPEQTMKKHGKEVCDW